MITYFRSTAAYSSTFASSKVYARINSVADNVTVYLRGVNGVTPIIAEVACTDREEVLSDYALTELTRVSTPAPSRERVTVFTPGTPATSTVTLAANPADGQIWTVGLVGKAVTYRFKDVVVNANDVTIAATSALTAVNLRKAINADGVEEVDYGYGTEAHPHLAATFLSSDNLTVDDRLGCERALAWVSYGSAPIHMLAPSGGIDGDVVVTLLPGETLASNPGVLLRTTILEENNIPPEDVWTSAPVVVRGRPFSLHISTANVTTPMAVSYEYCNDNALITWFPGLSTLADLDSNNQIVTPAELCEFVRLVIDNTNTVAASVNASLVRG